MARGKKIVDVEVKRADGSWEPCTESQYTGTAAAEKWIKNFGEDSRIYRIITIEKEITLTVEFVRKAVAA